MYPYEVLSCFTGKGGSSGISSRLAAHRAGAVGAANGLAAALARISEKPVAPSIRTGATTQAAATTRPKASTNSVQSRIQIVAHALANDPALKGKAALALDMLADDDCANVSANGIVKLLKAGASASPQTAQNMADARDKAMRAEMRAAITSTGNSNIAADGGAGSQKSKPGGSWSYAIAKVNRLNGFQ